MSEHTQSERFRELALPHLDAAYNLARWLTRDDHEARDMVQDAFLRAFRSFDGFRGANARPWLLAIVRNVCYDWLRQHRGDAIDVAWDESLHGGSIASEALPAIAADPESYVERADTRRLVNAALAKLPVAFREVVILRDIEDLSYKEIADVAGIPIGTVMSRLARARKLLMADLASIATPEGR